MQSYFDTAISALFINPYIGLYSCALIIATAALVVFRYTSRPQLIKYWRDQAWSHVLEFQIFRSDPLVILRAFHKLGVAQLNYLRYLAIPFFISLVLIGWFCLHIQHWTEFSSIKPGQKVLCKVTTSDSVDLLSAPIILKGNPGDYDVGMPIRIPSLHMIIWPIKALRHGAGDLKVRISSEEIPFQLTVTANNRPIVQTYQVRPTHGFSFNPRSKGLAPDANIQSICITYPVRSWKFWGIDWNGLLLLILISCVMAFFLRKPFGVEL